MKTLDLSKSSKNFANFYKFADKYRQKHGGIFDFRNSKQVKMEDGICSGFFEEKNGGTITVATKHRLFESIFVHEFCHFMQFVEQEPLYTDNNDSFWDGLSKKRSDINNWDSIISTIALERDCEQRSLKFIKKYELYDPEKYAQNANAYFYFYHYVFLRNSWSSTGRLYDSVLPNMMPKKILPMKCFDKIDMDIMKEYYKHLK